MKEATEIELYPNSMKKRKGRWMFAKLVVEVTH
jgi:hypothetical protein